MGSLSMPQLNINAPIANVSSSYLQGNYRNTYESSIPATLNQGTAQSSIIPGQTYTGIEHSAYQFNPISPSSVQVLQPANRTTSYNSRPSNYYSSPPKESIYGRILETVPASTNQTSYTLPASNNQTSYRGTYSPRA